MARATRRGEAETRRLSSLLNSTATKTSLKAIPARLRHGGLTKLVEADGSRWRFHASSSASDTSENLVLTPDSGSGRWLRVPSAVLIELPITSATADAATLFTTPTGALLAPRRLFWKVGTNFSGNGVVGASSAKTGFTSKGDLLGGASGETATNLVTSASPYAGTVGTKLDTVAELHAVLFKAGDTIRFDILSGTLSAGAGSICVIADLLENAGALAWRTRPMACRTSARGLEYASNLPNWLRIAAR